MAECVFCQIAAKQVPAKVVYEDEQIIAFKDIKPVAPVHILVIPKRHIASLQATQPGDEPLLGDLLGVARQIAADQGLEEGYRVVINIGKDGGQMVEHLHLHVIGGKQLADLLP